MQSQKSKAALMESRQIRSQLVERLESEDEPDLASRLRACATPFRLNCTNCGHVHTVEQGCRQKWCPVCVRRIAAMRAAKYALAVGMMEWPLFVTLTAPHNQPEPLQALRRIKRGFGKLRHTKLWKSRTVGGVGGLEITSRSGEFHPHLHTVIDCKWLAWYTRPPQRGDSKAVIKAKCLAASDELGLTWARCLGIQSINPNWCGTIFKVKRCDREGIETEVLKYSVKGSDLLRSKEPIGPVIRALQATRLVTSFGSLFGKRRLSTPEPKQARACEKCGESNWMPDLLLDRVCRDIKEKSGRR